MEVILLEKVQNLGNLGQTVKVRAGYGRNYLIPNGKAVMATPDNIAQFEARRAELEKMAAAAIEEAQARAARLAELGAVTIASRVGEEGRLFGSVGAGDIADAITAAGVEVKKREVLLPAGPLRTAGEHTVRLQLHSDVEQEITVNVVPE